MGENSEEWLRKGVERIGRSLIQLSLLFRHFPKPNEDDQKNSQSVSWSSASKFVFRTSRIRKQLLPSRTRLENLVLRQTQIAEHDMQMSQCNALVMRVYRFEQRRDWEFSSSGQWLCVVGSRCFKGKYRLDLQFSFVPGKTAASVQLGYIIILIHLRDVDNSSPILHYIVKIRI